MAGGGTPEVVGPGIQDAAEASRVLADIAAAERSLAAITTALATDVEALRAAADARAIPLRARIERLTARLQGWAWRNRIRLGRGRSIPLTTGRLDWVRLPDRVDVVDEEALVRWLVHTGRTRFLRADRLAIQATPVLAATLPGVRIHKGGEAVTLRPAVVPPASRSGSRHVQPLRRPRC